jgi:hypothetical protein
VAKAGAVALRAAHEPRQLLAYAHWSYPLSRILGFSKDATT